MEETMLTVQEVAKILRVSDSTIRRWIAEGKIKGLKFGGQWRFKSAEISQWLETKKRSSLRGIFKGGKPIAKEAIDEVKITKGGANS